MEIMLTIGARCFSQYGPLAVPGEVWCERVLTAPAGARRRRAGSPFHRAFVNLIGIDLPVTDRMRTSASEP